MRAICAVLLLAAGAVQAATTGLQARDINGDGTVDAYYDPAANLTWSADANLPGTLGVSEWPDMGGTTALSGALSFVKTLNLYGVIGWRLPRVFGAHCFASDMGCTATSFESPFAAGTAPWRNLGSSFYWSESMGTSDQSGDLWCLMGGDCTNQASVPGGVWAVHDGDIMPSPVPEPSTVALFLAGLLALPLARQRRGAGRRVAG